MYRRILIGGMTAAAIVGAGGTALALTGSDSTTTGTPSGTAAKAHAGKHPGKQGKGRLLRRLEHAQIVTKGKDGAVTHDLIAGTVTAVSPTSITVQSLDKKSETFAIAKDTKVRMRSAGKATDSTIAGVVKGDHVMVAGTGTTHFTAKHVVDVKKKK